MSYEEPESRGLSTGAIVTIVIGVGGLVLALACCGGVVYFGKSAVTKFQQAMTDDPQQIAAIASSIVDIDIPPEYPPAQALNLDWFGMQMKMCFYMQPDESRGIVLMQMLMPGQINQEQMKQQFRQSLKQQGRDQQIDVTSSETRKFTIGGEECEFEFLQGKDQSGTDVRHVSGVFTGRGGPAFLMVFEREETWDEEAIVRMIESMGSTASPAQEAPMEAAVPADSPAPATN